MCNSGLGRWLLTCTTANLLPAFLPGRVSHCSQCTFLAAHSGLVGHVTARWRCDAAGGRPGRRCQPARCSGLMPVTRVYGPLSTIMSCRSSWNGEEGSSQRVPAGISLLFTAKGLCACPVHVFDRPAAGPSLPRRIWVTLMRDDRPGGTAAVSSLPHSASVQPGWLNTGVHMTGGVQSRRRPSCFSDFPRSSLTAQHLEGTASPSEVAQR